MTPLGTVPVAATGAVGIPALLLTLAAVLAGTTLLGLAARRIRQPAVLGELIAGIVLGGSVLGVLDPHEPVMHAFSELGVLVLLFAVGLETDLRALWRVGREACTVGTVGIVLPFAGGLAVALALGASRLTAVVVAASLTATSVGISARVLGDLGRLHDDEGQVVLGAAVLDDVVGLVILAVVAGLVAGESVTALGVARIAGVAVGFVAAAIFVGTAFARRLMRVVGALQVAGVVGVAALAFAFVIAALAALSGSAMIVGAFAAGLALHDTPQRHEIERWATSLGHVLVPIFFASVGAQVDLRALASPTALGLGAALVVVAVVGKMAAGYAPWWFAGNKLLVGAAMVPRGEVGLVFAQMGAAAGVLSGATFGAVIAMVIVTTFLTPPLLQAIAGAAPPGGGDGDASSGLNELVTGAAQRTRRATVPRKKISE